MQEIFQTPNRSKLWLIIICCAATIISALLPSVAPFLPTGYLEALPDPDKPLPPFTAFGPSSLMILQLISVIVAGITITVCTSAGARPIRWLNAILLLAIAVCFYQSTQSYNDAIISVSWVGAISLGIAAIYLAQFPIAQKMIVASLCALIIPYAIDSIYYIFIEQPFTIAQFYKNEDQFLLNKGWEQGSPQHQLFVRRMESPDAIGVFGLANVYGSILASISMIVATLFFANILSKKKHIPTILITLIILALNLVTIFLTHSKGAIGIIPIGFALILLLWLATKLKNKFKLSRYLLPVIAVSIILLPLILVIARGLMGPPDSVEGERSLLFRYQYWSAAINIFAFSGLKHLLLGTGPSGFGWQYLIHKNPINPEEVTSAHNIFIDYIVTLGITGLLLSTALIAASFQTIKRLLTPAKEEMKEQIENVQSNPTYTPSIKPLVYLGLVIAAATFGLQYAVTYKQLIAETAIMWLLGVAAFIAVFVMLISNQKLNQFWYKIALLTSAVVVIAHNQVEMSFFQFSSVNTVWLICGAAIGCTLNATAKTNKIFTALPVIASIIFAIVLFSITAKPVIEYQKNLKKAESNLHVANITQALYYLDQAAEVELSAPEANRFRLQIRGNIAQTLAKRNNTTQAKQFLDVALKQVDQYIQTGAGGASPYRYQANLYQIASSYNLIPNATAKAEQSYLQALQRSPYNLNDHIDLANLYFNQKEYNKAKTQYDKAVELSELYYLDPGKQLTDKQKTHINQQLGKIQSSDQLE
ncbi:O-antigen ligase family protein [Planctomycetota bacterium]|nr:O-antigen ligase family protein [Planctomycetota bacterium]